MFTALSCSCSSQHIHSPLFPNCCRPFSCPRFKTTNNGARFFASFLYIFLDPIFHSLDLNTKHTLTEAASSSSSFLFSPFAIYTKQPIRPPHHTHIPLWVLTLQSASPTRAGRLNFSRKRSENRGLSSTTRNVSSAITCGICEPTKRQQRETRKKKMNEWMHKHRKTEVY